MFLTGRLTSVFTKLRLMMFQFQNVYQSQLWCNTLLSGDSHSRLLLGNIALFIETQYFFHLPSLGQFVNQLV